MLVLLGFFRSGKAMPCSGTGGPGGGVDGSSAASAAGRSQGVGGVHQRSHVAERVGHAGVPGRAAFELGGMIGDQHAGKTLVAQDPDDLDDVDVAIVDEGLDVVGYLTLDVAKMDVADAVPP